MCLILVAWRVHPEYPCVIAANRDEFHSRPTLAAHWWKDSPTVLAGQDLIAGGTWLGMTRTGRVAALTNQRHSGVRRQDAPSRGHLVTKVLESRESLEADLSYLLEVGGRYNKFNLIFTDGRRLGVVESGRGDARELGPGLYGLSNHFLDTPWPKVENGKSRLNDALSYLPDQRYLLSLLRDDELAPDDRLPETGLPLEWERLLSSSFVRASDYGTRSSTLLMIDRDGLASFDEWSWDASGADIGRVNERFSITQCGNRRETPRPHD
jgi:uncharacterized protein with NRDE domain